MANDLTLHPPLIGLFISGKAIALGGTGVTEKKARISHGGPGARLCPKGQSQRVPATQGVGALHRSGVRTLLRLGLRTTAALRRKGAPNPFCVCLSWPSDTVRPMAFPLPFASVDRRTAWLRATLLSASLLGMIASTPLWLNSRVFPLLPIAGWFPVIPAPWDKLFFGALLLTLVLACWFYRPAIGFFLVAGLFAYFEDQNRGQPWFYMYWVMLGLTLLPDRTALAACQWALSGAYVWSGIQKCHAKFFLVVPGWFVSPAANWHWPAGMMDLLRWLVASAPVTEIFIGLALWIKPLKGVAIGAAVLVHLLALLFLGPLGHNYNWVVWPWNLAMIALVVVLFATLPSAQLRPALADLRRSKLGTAAVALFWFLPVLSYGGWWDSYFSFTLYSEHEAKADMFVNQAFRERLPPRLQAHVHPLRVAYDPVSAGAVRVRLPKLGFSGIGYTAHRRAAQLPFHLPLSADLLHP